MSSVMRFDEWQDSNGNPVYDGSRGALPIGRNLLYNGAMQVHQRGTSATGITGAEYNTADRWRNRMVSMGTWTNTIENDGPTGSGFTKSYKLMCTTADSSPAAGDSVSIRQSLEGLDLQSLKKGTSNAESLTLSFWVKSNTTGVYIVELQDEDNTRKISASYTISSSATWEKKVITFNGDTTGALDNDNASSLIIGFYLGAGSNFTSGSLNTSWSSTADANRAVGQTNLAAATNNYWQITGVQLEAGTVATPFEHKAYGEELAECQRYYYKYRDVEECKFNGYTTSSAQKLVTFFFPVVMRIAPVVTTYDAAGTSGRITTLSAAGVGTNNVTPDLVQAKTNSVLVYEDGAHTGLGFSVEGSAEL